MAQSSPSKLATSLALAIVAAVVIRYYAPWLAPAEVRGLVSKALGAAQALCYLAALCILSRMWLRRMSGAILLAATYAAWEEAQGMICPIWYIFDPWIVPTGAAMCSARAGYDFGVLGAAIAAGLAWLLYTQGQRDE